MVNCINYDNMGLGTTIYIDIEDNNDGQSLIGGRLIYKNYSYEIINEYPDKYSAQYIYFPTNEDINYFLNEFNNHLNSNEEMNFQVVLP